MPDYRYHVYTSEQSSQLNGLKPELPQSFGAFNAKAFEEGALSQKVKELIAVTAAHVTRVRTAFLDIRSASSLV